MIKASEARRLTNHAELKLIERDLEFIYKNIESCALSNCSHYSYCIDHLSKQGQKFLKYTLKDDGYTVRRRVSSMSGSESYVIEW